MTIILTAIAIILFRFGGNYHEGPWLGLSVAIVAWFGREIYNRLGVAPALLISYLLFHSVWIYLYSNRYSETGEYLMSIKWGNAESALKLIGFSALGLRASRMRPWELRDIGAVMCLIFFLFSCGNVFWEWAFHGCAEINSCGGALFNPSLNAGLLVSLLPIVSAMLSHWLALPIAAMAILVGKSNVGLGMLGGYMAYLAVKKRPILLAAIPVLFLAAHLTHGDKVIFSSGDRFEMWRFLLSEWSHNKIHWVFGTGFGTFPTFSYILQKQLSTHSDWWWVWMHNDWLQMLFECGAVGLLLMIATWAAALWGLVRKSYRREAEALSLFGVAASLNYPLHIAFPCGVATWLLTLGLGRQGCQRRIY